VWLRRAERTPSPLTGLDPFPQRLAVTIGRTGGMLVGAYLAGVLVIGAGARLMMRVLAATSPEDVQGLRTEADAIVGDVTVGGSAFLIVALGLGAGVVGLALFAALRRWLPSRSLAAGVIGSAIGAGLLVRPSGLVSADNVDFTILEPTALGLGMCLVIIVLFGATFGVLVDRLAPRWPRPGWSLRGIASILPFAVLLLSPPLLLAALAGVFFGTVAPTLPRSVASQGQLPVGAESGGARFGAVAVVAAGALGGVSVLVAAGQVLVL
jgi:hypothetical protein